ncbi:MAG: hypothetical protein ABWZ91_08900 [Nocardioides sp.]|jgi:YVTN family beta-propeller protein
MVARYEGLDGAPEILSDGGPEEPAAPEPPRGKIVAVAVAAFVLAASGGYYLGSRGAPADKEEAAADGVVVIPVPGGNPSGAGLAAGSVWVTTWDGSVLRMDPESREVEATVAVGEGPLAAGEGFGSVWVTSSADGTVTRIDPEDNSVLGTIEVGPVPFQIAAAGGGMWVATQDAAVKIDPGENRVVLRVPYPKEPTAQTPSTAGVGLDADERGVWVSTAHGTVLRLRPDNGRLVETIRVLPDAHTSPGSVAIDGNHVWVSNWAVESAAGPGAGVPRLGATVGIVDIDATTNEIIHRVRSAGYPVSGMLPRDGSVYMVGGYDENHTSVLIRADFPYEVLTSMVPVGGSSFDVVAVNGSLWVPSFEEKAVYVLPDEVAD